MKYVVHQTKINNKTMPKKYFSIEEMQDKYYDLPNKKKVEVLEYALCLMGMSNSQTEWDAKIKGMDFELSDIKIEGCSTYQKTKFNEIDTVFNYV